MYKWLVLAMLVVGPGCKKRPPTPAPAAPPVAVDAIAVPFSLDPAQARFSVKLNSPKLGIVAPPLGGGLIVNAKDGQAFVNLLNPVGGSLLTVAVNGAHAVFINAYDRQVVEGDIPADELVFGSVTVPDLMAMLTGRVLIPPGMLQTTALVDGVRRSTAAGPSGSRLTLDADPVTGTPRALTASQADGTLLMTAAWEPFSQLETGEWVPTRLNVVVPSLELTAELTYKGWTRPDPVPNVFSPVAPGSFEAMTFQEYGARMKAKMAEREAKRP